MRWLNGYRMRLMLLVLFLALGLASVSLAAEGIWTTKADMPTARFVTSSGVVDGKIYVFGGSPDGHICFPTVEEYDPATDTWTRKGNMPMSKGAPASSVVNGKIYVIGGGPYLYGEIDPRVQEYDATTDTWTAKANIPTARSWLSTSVVDGKIYAIGGAYTYKGTVFSTVEEYDPATDTWRRKADMPTARACLSTNAVNGRIYAIGGTPGSGEWYQGLSTVEEYDPATDTWTTKADMPTARTYISTCEVNGRIYAIGGLTTGAGDHLSPVEEYDPATDTWTRKADMPTARSGLITCAVNGKMYAIGGWADSNWTGISTVEEYEPYPLVVDFNGDGIVDSADICIMIDHWHTDFPLCDIAPAPFGDGIVNVQDLILLSEHLFEDYRMIAHWMLDEESGETAHDSAGNYNGTLHGEPLWQPEGGILDGGLEFDGNDDYISTSFVLNPEEKSFSAFAWIQGGAPGQVIISQSDTPGARGTIPGCTWLGTNPSNGSLMTGLMDTVFGALESDSIITDGQWHHIGLVYDLVTMRRHLYLDGAEVAVDTDFIGGVQTTGGLYIGAGQALDPSTFFSGLIDDVRIYNVALTAEQIAVHTQ